MIKQLVLIIVAIATIIAARAAFVDGQFRVERSITVQAPPEKIFPLLNDFQQFARWSPWEKLDTAMARQISTPAAGKGAVYEWRGNSDAGAGRMEIIAATPPSDVRVALTRITPFETRSTLDYTLRPSANGTTVTWAMHGPSPFLLKVVQVFMPMDDMVGGDFERGLASIKRLAEE